MAFNKAIGSSDVASECVTGIKGNANIPPLPLCCAASEPIYVEVVFRNPLKVQLVLSDLSLLWKFTPKDFSGPQGGSLGETITNEKEEAMGKVRPLRLHNQQIRSGGDEVAFSSVLMICG